MLSGMLLGVFCSSAGFLAWPTVSKPSRVSSIIIENTIAGEKIVQAGVTVVTPGGSRPVKKLYTDRIEPVLSVISQERRALETPKRVIQPAGETDGCKPGRTQNAKGQCGRWPFKGIPRVSPAQKEHNR